MRYYGRRHMVVLLCGVAVALATAIFAVADRYGIALAGVSLLLGLSLAVALDNRQRLRHVLAIDMRQAREVVGRLDAVSARLLASIETERTEAVDRHVETMAKLGHLTAGLSERSNGLG